MLPPWLKLVTDQPQLLAEHAEGYADLLQAEAAALSTVWRRQAVLGALTVGSAAVAAVLAGVALMLWATVAPGQAQAPWLLWAVPLLPLAAAAPLRNLRQQLQADWRLLRETESP